MDFDVGRERRESAAGLEFTADVNFEGRPLRTRPWDTAVDSPAYLLSGRQTLVMLRGFKRVDALGHKMIAKNAAVPDFSASVLTSSC